MPLARRVPKRGFNNIFAKPLTSVNVSQLERFEEGTVIDCRGTGCFWRDLRLPHTA